MMVFAVLCLISCDSNQTGPVTLEWWQFSTDPAIKPTIEKMVADFETKNPGIKIKITDLTWANGHDKIVLAFSSGTAPDIIELGSDWIAEFALSGQLADITTDVQNDKAAFFGWQPTAYNDRIYAFPWILGTRVLYVNNSLSRKAGLADDFIPFNWDLLKEMCYKIDSLGKDIYGFGANAAEKHTLYKKFLPFLWSNGGYLISTTGKFSTFATDRAYDALKYYKELCDSTGLVDTQRRLEDAFLEGKVGVIISGDWLLKRIRNENHKIDFSTHVFPGPKYPGISFLGGEYLAISESCPHQEAAIKFIRHIVSKENQLEFCRANMSANPSNKAAAEDPFFTEDPHLATFVRQLQRSRMPEIDKNWVYIEDIVERTLENILFNGVPMAEGLYGGKKEIEKIIQKPE
jgi:multiple sugar transport system substrate-binding protein